MRRTEKTKFGVRVLWSAWALAVPVAGLLWATGSPYAGDALLITLSFFGGAEILGAFVDETFSQFVGRSVGHPVLRWGLGVAQATLAWLMLGWVIGAALFLVLPAHYVAMASNRASRGGQP